ncbi:formimidoylglutamase [Spongiivirga sp. MCCC 1A20706]|uniref:formimidoylglutamase n=1 Tax=Spongiivirga sp. MCCC 1A20706 TaxID=3160963 RepID=UPI0039774893
MSPLDLHIQYQSGENENWSGRNTDPKSGVQYWYQAISPASLTNTLSNADIGLIGYACDEGVQRNLGRIGAVNGPTVIKERLAKLAYHHFDKTITNFGDVACIDHNLEACQDAFAMIISKLLSNKIFPIGIGGGHDIAYAHFKGIHEFVKNQPKNRIGIINFDAHFDLRPVRKNGNSGTPFNQILNEFDKVSYFALGIQKASNTKELFDIANTYNVQYAVSSECTVENITQIKQRLENFLSTIDYLYITIDLDGFSSAYAPGVSAPSPLGFDPNFVNSILKYLFKSKKVISCDLAEMNAEYDLDSSTANLAARLIDGIVGFVNKVRFHQH